MQTSISNIAKIVLPTIIVILTSWILVSLPQSRVDEVAAPAYESAPTINVSRSQSIKQIFLFPGQPIVGLILFSPDQSLSKHNLLLTIYNADNKKIIEARPYKYESHNNLLAIIYHFAPLTAPNKTSLQFEISNSQTKPISLFLNEDNSYTNGQIIDSSLSNQTDLAFSFRHPSSTPSATKLGVIAGLITLVASLFITWLPRHQWLAVSLLIIFILPLAVAGFWFSPNEWGQSDWNLYFPMHEVFRETILTHHTFPLWNPYIAGGVSALGDPEFSVITPTFILQLIFGIPLGFKLSILFSIVVSGLGMLALSKRLGLSPLASFLTAIAFPLSSTVLLKFVEGHIQHLSIAWIPWIFWSWLTAYRSLKNSDQQNIKSRLTSKWVILSGFTLALTFYQGGIYMLFYIIPALFIIVLLTKKPLVALRTTLATGLWSFGFSAFKLFPVINWIREFPDDKFVTSSFSLPYWYDIYLRPHLHGVKILPNQSGGWHEYGAYIGPIVLLLAVLSLSHIKRKKIIFILFIGTILATITATSGPILKPIFDVITWLPRSNISRLALFSVLGTALLAGFGIDILRQHRNNIGRQLATIFVGIAAISIMSLSYPMSEQAFIVPPVSPSLSPAPSPISFTEDPQSIHVNGTEENRSYANVLAGFGTLVYRPPLAPPIKVIPITEERSDYLDVSDPEADYQLESWQPNKVVVSFSALQLTDITLNTNYSIGWHVNQQPASNNLGRLNTTVPPGDHIITFYYRPPGFYIGIVISLATIILAVIALRFTRPKNQK